jgi:hypothetical protein
MVYKTQMRFFSHTGPPQDHLTEKHLMVYKTK